MTEEKGLDGAIADRIGEYVKRKGGPELFDQLKADTTLTANKNAKEGLADMGTLFTLLRAYKVLDRVCLSYSPFERKNPHASVDILRLVTCTWAGLLYRYNLRGYCRSQCPAGIQGLRTRGPNCD